MRLGRRESLVLLLLAAAPVLAYAPALWAGRILAPREGAALHLPLRVEVWRAYARGELPSWNPAAFSGTPLLASYRPGAFHPLMVALAALPPLAAFQLLVLLSLALTGPLVYLYLRRLGAETKGALLAALGYCLGPYLVARLGDTPTLVAAPALPLMLLAAEALLASGRAAAVAALAGAVALLALAGSPEALGAGALLLAARLALGLLLAAVRGSSAAPSLSASRALATVAAVVAGMLLAAPQLVPTLLAISEAGASSHGTAPALLAALGGMAGLVVRSVSHTPAPIFALAAVPLVPAVRGLRQTTAFAGVLLLALAALGRLDGPGALTLALELAVNVLAGLSFSVQWRLRCERRGRRLRLLAAVVALAAAAALSIATTVTGPLNPRLAAPVGLLALGLILYFALAESPSPTLAQLFLLPLLASFLMQPWGRESWARAPTARELVEATPTREALDRAMGPRRADRTLTLLESPPTTAAAADLAWGAYAPYSGRHSANGDDPLVPALRRRVFDGMRADGTLPRALLETDPGRLELLGIRWLQVPTDTLVTEGRADGLGDELDVVLEAPRPHVFELPITRASELRIVSFLAGATQVEQGRVVAECVVRLATGRELVLPIRAGIDTAEWAWDRADVRPQVKHGKAQIYASFPAREGFLGHQYSSVLSLQGRFFVSSLRFRVLPGAPPLWLLRAGLRDGETGRATGVGVASAYGSDEVRLAQAVHTPLVSLFEVRRGIGPAWVVASLRRVSDEARALDILRSPTRLGVDARQEAVATQADAAGIELPAGSRSSMADVVRTGGPRIVVRAVGPGLLVIAEGYDPGWSATVDARPRRLLRVNGDRMGVMLPAGHHRVVLRHHARGLALGALLALLAVLALGAAVVRERLLPV
jgi:hypothetical protein